MTVNIDEIIIKINDNCNQNQGTDNKNRWNNYQNQWNINKKQ